MQCVAVTATSCTDSNIYNVWPANFLQGATFQVISGTAIGLTGTITSSTAASHSGKIGVIFNFAATSTPLPVNSWLIVQKTVPGNAQAGWWPTVNGGATLSTDTTDIAPDSPGKQALAINASGSGQSASVDSYFDSTAGRSFVQLNGTYTLAFKAKGLGGNNQLNISVIRALPSAANETLFNQTVTLTGQWQDYTYTFNAAEDGTFIGTVAVSFSVAGASMYLDDTSLTEAAAPGNPTAYRNAVVNTLKSLQPGVLRYMALSDYGTSIDNVIAVPFARQRAGWSPQATEQDAIPMGLEEFLVLCQTVGAEPWNTMPGACRRPTCRISSVSSWGCFDDLWRKARRPRSEAPWTTVFPVIHLELGNEMWNGIYEGEGIADPVVYGNRAATIFAAARRRPLSTRVSSTDHRQPGGKSGMDSEVMAASSGYDSIDAAPYLFNSFNDSSSNEAIFGPMFAQPEEVDSNSSGYMAQQAQAASGGSTPASLRFTR